MYHKDEDLLDTDLRHFAEDCDNLQGFQLTFDTSDFGGFTSLLQELIEDEYPKKDIFTFPILSAPEQSNPLNVTSALKLNEELATSLTRSCSYRPYRFW